MLLPGPDRGYSWVIVLCCAYLNLAFFGLVRSSGVMYVALLNEFGTTREEASWPFSICSAVFQLSGPLGSVLLHFLTLRKACIIGSVVATLGIVCCYFANSIMWVNIFYGVVHGSGFGFVATLVPVIVSQYFIRHRATAIGIAFSGGPISSFVFPQAIEYLLKEYDLRGTFLILGGVVMNTIVACSLLRAPPWLNQAKCAPGPKEQKMLSEKEESDPRIQGSADLVMDIKSILEKPLRSEDGNIYQNNDWGIDHRSSGIIDPKHEMQIQVMDSAKKEVEATKIMTADSRTFANDMPDILSYKPYQKDTDDRTETLPFLNVDNKVTIVVKRASIPNIKPKRSGLMKSVFDLLHCPMFYLLAMTINIFFLGIHSFFMVIVDFGKDKGIPEQEIIYVLFAFSLTDLCGRLCFGWITDRSYVKRKTMLMINLAVVGLFNQLYPVVNHLLGLLVVAAIHGLFVGISVTLLFVLQAEYMGMKMLALAIGLTSFINGISTFLRPSMIGMFRDVIGTYNWMFHFLGILYFAVTISWFAEPWLRNKNQVNHEVSRESLKNHTKETGSHSPKS